MGARGEESLGRNQLLFAGGKGREDQKCICQFREHTKELGRAARGPENNEWNQRERQGVVLYSMENVIPRMVWQTMAYFGAKLLFADILNHHHTLWTTRQRE